MDALMGAQMGAQPVCTSEFDEKTAFFELHGHLGGHLDGQNTPTCRFCSTSPFPLKNVQLKYAKNKRFSGLGLQLE